MASRKDKTITPGYMQMMAEKAAAYREATGSGSASGSGTVFVSTTPDPRLHAGTSPAQTGTPPPPVLAADAADDGADGVFPGPVHPTMNVPGHVPYASLRVEDILAQPGHDSLRRLDPHKSADTYW
ncbi:unnamed protein product [Cochlearia groenlandica]